MVSYEDADGGVVLQFQQLLENTLCCFASMSPLGFGNRKFFLLIRNTLLFKEDGAAHLKLRPVHGHAGAVIEPEPFQVLLGVSSSESVFQRLVDGLKPTERARDKIILTNLKQMQPKDDALFF